MLKDGMSKDSHYARNISNGGKILVVVHLWDFVPYEKNINIILIKQIKKIILPNTL